MMTAPPSNAETMRISRYLARCGVASRRDSEAVVLAGRVRVNGVVIVNLAHQVNPAADRVELDGRPLVLAPAHLTLLMNKPRGVLVTRDDPKGRKTVYTLLSPGHAVRARELTYAGRLDYDTSGLLILTTDGELANRLVHPRYHVDKAYRARLDRGLTPAEITRLEAGIELEEATTLPCRVRPLRGGSDRDLYEIMLQEGRNRQVRRMIESVGAKVLELERTRIGGLRLEEFFPNRKAGTRELTERDVERLLGGEKAG